MPDVHLKYGPSGSKHWLNCAGAINVPQEKTTSEAAEHGTGAHELMEQCFLLDMDPEYFRGQKFNGYEADDEMIQGVQIMLDTIQSETEALKEFGVPLVQIEEFQISPANTEFGGTIDCRITCGNHVTIVDFKFGKMNVPAVGNTQLLCYGVLSFGEHSPDQQKDLKDEDVTLRCVVVQPRTSYGDPVKTWDVPTEDLIEFRENLNAVLEAGTSETFTVGDQCTWCPRRLNCPELYELTIQKFDEQFKKDAKEVQSDMTPEKAAELMPKIKGIQAYVKAVQAYVHTSLEHGTDIPGYKLVQKYSNRKYKIDEDQILKQARKLGKGKRDIYVSEIMSPAKLEKVLGKTEVNAMCHRVETSTSVVPESDKREAVRREDPVAAFDKFIEQEELS